MKRILIVDDERVIADTLGLIFQRSDFSVRTAYSTQEALRCAGEFDPELLLCDITMPDRDGVALIQDMAKEHPDCRVLVLTGNHGNLERVREETGSTQRPAGVLFKPCQPAEVLREAWLTLSRA